MMSRRTRQAVRNQVADQSKDARGDQRCDDLGDHSDHEGPSTPTAACQASSISDIGREPDKPSDTACESSLLRACLFCPLLVVPDQMKAVRLHQLLCVWVGWHERASPVRYRIEGLTTERLELT
jgi:hypothetical protein